MRREELNLGRGVWNIPRGTMPQGNPHAVPSSSAAQGIIRSQPEQNDKAWGPYVFGVGGRGERPCNGRSNGIEEVRPLTRRTGWARHDYRRIFLILMKRFGIPREVRLRMAAHALPRDSASACDHYDFKEGDAGGRGEFSR